MKTILAIFAALSICDAARSQLPAWFMVHGGIPAVTLPGITAASPAWVDVSNAVAIATNGETVNIPAGTATWFGTLNVSGVTLLGAGSNATIIVDETPKSQVPLLEVNTTTNLTRISGIQFMHGVTNNAPYLNYLGEIAVFGTNNLWRVDHCFFYAVTGKPVHVEGSCYGLIDHNCVYFTNTAESFDVLEVQDSGFGDASWAAPYTYGSSNAVYVEDNIFYNSDYLDQYSTVGIDVDGGGRICVRYNTFTGVYFNTHGTETGGDYRSVRSFEVYSNTFQDSAASQANMNFSFVCCIRGGTGIICSNVAAGYQFFAPAYSYRASDNDPAFAPFYGATGTNGWDSNSVALLTGTASATSNTLYVAGASWTPNQFYGDTVLNTNPVNGSIVMGIVETNDAQTMRFATARTASYQFYITNGQAFQVHLAYPQIDQVGMGQGNLVTSHATASWPFEISQPVYCWGNSLIKYQSSPTVWNSNMISGGVYVPAAGMILYPAGPPSTAVNIQEGRDYTNAPLASFTPYTYPHPLDY